MNGDDSVASRPSPGVLLVESRPGWGCDGYFFAAIV
jgi:hypothetical protein